MRSAQCCHLVEVRELRTRKSTTTDRVPQIRADCGGSKSSLERSVAKMDAANGKAGATAMLGQATLALIIALVAVILLLIWRPLLTHLRIVKALWSIPGPTAYPIVGNFFKIMGGSNVFFQVQRECYEEYGPLFRLWIGPFPFVFLAGHEQVQPILSSSVHIEKSYEYRCLKSWLATGLLTSGGKKWHSRRKLLTGAFHTSLLESYIDSLSLGAEVLISKINGHLSKNNPVDWSEDINMVPLIKLVALDAICKTIMGFNMKALEGGKNSEYVEAIHRSTEILQFRFISPWLRSDILFNISSYGKEYNKNIAVIHKFTQKVIKERKEEMKASEENKTQRSGKARKSFLDLLLDLSENGNVLSDEDIREEVDTFMFAGHDTTAAAISFALFALGNHPEVQEKIVNEAEELLADMDTEKLTVAHLGKFEYLDCVVKECLRVYPSVPIIARELQSPMTICGHTFPAKTCLLISTFLLHRDPAFFPNPEVFDPDRFKNSGNKNRNPFTYTPFSAGSRNCIGQRFALLEIKMVILKLLLSFELKSSKPMDKLIVKGDIVLNSPEDILIAFKKRNAA